jgi:hypothetical protein
VVGDEEAADFIAASQEWLQERRARVEEVATIRAGSLVAHEAILHLKQGDQTVALPVALVGEVAEERFAAVRVYHSLWPVLGAHQIRPPLVPANPTVRLGGVIGRYQHALAAGDVVEVVRAFEPNGYVREPSGPPHVHRGEAELERFYTALFSNGGGIPLIHCTIADDGVRCAIEYIVRTWGRTELPPQAGVAIYERSSAGLLQAARIYDDIEPPTDGA